MTGREYVEARCTRTDPANQSHAYECPSGNYQFYYVPISEFARSATVESLTARVAANEQMQSQVDTLFDLASDRRQELRKGVAAATAMAQPHFPSEAGRTSYASNVAVFRGEMALSAGIMHRFDRDFGISAGVSVAGDKHAAIRAGVAGEF
jgi:trimeric autotransporter adhesin